MDRSKDGKMERWKDGEMERWKVNFRLSVYSTEWNDRLKETVMLELNKIYNEDCLEGMKKIPDGSIDCIITDPPYCVGISSNGLKTNYTDFNLIRPFFEQFFGEWQRILKAGAYCYTFTDWRTYPILYPVMQKYLTPRNLIVWEKGILGAGNTYRFAYELIMFATKGKTTRKFSAAERDIFKIPITASEAPINRVHPSQKPVQLIEKIIQDSTSPNETVLDACMGSGTTAVAAINTNRNFIGFELDEHYFEVANERIKKRLAEKESELFSE